MWPVGSHFQSIVDVDATPAEAGPLADHLLAWLVARGEVEPGFVRRDETSIEGVTVTTQRRVYYSLTGDQDIACPHCDVPTTLEDHLGEAVDEWYTTGRDLATCPSCRRDVGLNDWIWSPPWAFGYLGVTFWGWEWFSDDFLGEVAAQLGHRIVRPYGKL